MKVFYTTYLIRYIIGQKFDAISKIGQFDDLKAFLHDVIAIDVLNEVDAVRLDQFDQISLQLLPVLGEFDGLLHNPAPVAVLREL
jgi:hypothetical protein